jgi:hypothetical protein
MPPPRVVCCICGQEVNKAQTLHIGNGQRACKCHEGTIDASEVEKERIKKIKIENDKNDKIKNEKKKEEIIIDPHCLICGEKGIRQEEWFARLLINVKKHEIMFGNTKQFGVDEYLNKTKCLFYVFWRDENTKIKIPHDAYECIKLQECLDLDPILLVCRDCCIEKGFVTVSEERFRLIMNNENYAHVVSAIQAIASEELTKAAIKEMIESN